MDASVWIISHNVIPSLCGAVLPLVDHVGMANGVAVGSVFIVCVCLNCYAGRQFVSMKRCFSEFPTWKKELAWKTKDRNA